MENDEVIGKTKKSGSLCATRYLLLKSCIIFIVLAYLLFLYHILFIYQEAKKLVIMSDT